MKVLKKIILPFLVLFAVVFAGGFFYLFYDGQPYPSFSEEGLQHQTSSQLQDVKHRDTVFSKNIKIDHGWFTDPFGRIMNVRGMNLGGSSKLPVHFTSHTKEGFFETASTISFVGRPFPLEEAEKHFRRLSKWGFHFLRLLVTWEAIEHEGPGKYDEAYLEYIRQIVIKAGEHGINVFIDPHQDVWSRFTGGDGAPYWTLEVVGLDPKHFDETGAAFVHNIQGDPFPKMVWPTNYFKIGSATMFTLFFAGNDFAPHTKVDTTSIQDYLQAHYINAIKQVALKLKGLPNVIGFDSMNEPSSGYIGLSRLDSLAVLKSGASPTPFEGMAAGDGNPVEVGVWRFALTGPKEIGKKLINKSRQKIWKDGAEDIWKRCGVWGYDASEKPTLLKTDYFNNIKGHKVNFSEDYFKPFVVRFSAAMHEVDPDWIIFAEPATFNPLPKFSEPEKLVNATHWYDFVTLLTKEYYDWVNADAASQSVVLGRKNIRENFKATLGKVIDETHRAMGNVPTLMGEFGIPFDLNRGKSFSSEDFSLQEAAIDRCMNAMEANMLNYTYWNYTADNDNAHGDQWNGEDLSIFSLSQQKDTSDVNSGGRALAAVVRPYPYKVSGMPIRFFFDRKKGLFYLSFRNNATIHEPTEIFVPDFHYGEGYDALYTNGKLKKDTLHDLLLYYPEADTLVHQLILWKK